MSLGCQPLLKFSVMHVPAQLHQAFGNLPAPILLLLLLVEAAIHCSGAGAEQDQRLHIMV